MTDVAVPKPPKPRYAYLDELAEFVQAAAFELARDGEISCTLGRSPFYAGLSAKLCAAYRYLAEREPLAATFCEYAPLTLMRHKEPGAELSRWWIRTAAGEILDLEYDAGQKRKRFPYHEGRPASMRVDAEGMPRLKEARLIIERARRLLEAYEREAMLYR